MRPGVHNTTGPRQVRPTLLSRPNEPPTFPDSAEKALKSIATHFISNIDPKFKRSKTIELQAKLDAELFGLSPETRQVFWTPIQRLKLLNMICNFYSVLQADKRYEHFDLIFCGREGSGPIHEHRIDILTDLTKMAIQLPCFSLFEDIATWFMKIQSNVYAKRMITELVEDFILTPSESDLPSFLYPLSAKAFQFSCFFVVYSITEEYLCPQLVALIGEWLAEEPLGFLEFVAGNQALNGHFKYECIKPMILYDVKRSLDDDNHDKFHCVVTHILTQWRNINYRNGEAVSCLELNIFNDLIAESDKLPEFRRIRLAQNIKNSIRTGHYSLIGFNQCIQKFQNCFLVRSGEFDDLITFKTG